MADASFELRAGQEAMRAATRRTIANGGAPNTAGTVFGTSLQRPAFDEEVSPTLPMGRPSQAGVTPAVQYQLPRDVSAPVARRGAVTTAPAQQAAAGAVQPKQPASDPMMYARGAQSNGGVIRGQGIGQDEGLRRVLLEAQYGVGKGSPSMRRALMDNYMQGQEQDAESSMLDRRLQTESFDKANELNIGADTERRNRIGKINMFNAEQANEMSRWRTERSDKLRAGPSKKEQLELRKLELDVAGGVAKNERERALFDAGLQQNIDARDASVLSDIRKSNPNMSEQEARAELALRNARSMTPSDSSIQRLADAESMDGIARRLNEGGSGWGDFLTGNWDKINNDGRLSEADRLNLSPDKVNYRPMGGMGVLNRGYSWLTGNDSTRYVIEAKGENGTDAYFYGNQADVDRLNSVKSMRDLRRATSGEK